MINDIHRGSVDIIIQAPAKLNLFFEVLGKRADGFHEIETLMVPISLYDSIFFKEDPSGQIRLDCHGVPFLCSINGIIVQSYIKPVTQLLQF